MKLSFFDVDETLFFTSARVHIVKDGKVIKYLDNQEFNTYSIKPGESYDFIEFTDTDYFIETSKPNIKVINILKSMYEKNDKEDIYILTARSDFDNKDKLLSFFNSYGIKAGHKKDRKIHILRAGNMTSGNSAERKYKIVKDILKDNISKYSEVKMFDDSEANIYSFKSLEKEFNKEFKGYLIKGSNIKSV